MNPVKEFELQNHQELVEQFCLNYENEFVDYAENLGYYFYHGEPSEEHDEFFGDEVYNPSGHVVDGKEWFVLKEDFALEHPDYWSFVADVMNDVV